MLWKNVCGDLTERANRNSLSSGVWLTITDIRMATREMVVRLWMCGGG